ncbi:hypothetical protein PT974_12355 [Cladobotryum mycophilum]|uniref:Uncharacterized protein n=1 Tax=Cladobotryum mycophilum TaxID=491253 RepID=A0ABR0S8W8_9HYPO
MPFFGSRREPSPEPVYEPEPMPIQNAQEHQVPQKKHSIFSRHRDTSPTNTHRTASTRSSNAPLAGVEPGYNTNANNGNYNNHNNNGYNNSGYNGNGGGFNGSGPGSNAGSGGGGGGGVFRRSTDASNSGSGGGGGLKNLFRRGDDNNGNNLGSLDPSILQVREHVFSAEQAEIDADRALGEARMRVREAKDHLWRIEEEAKEEARRAKLKQEQAREVSKRGKGLGREYIVMGCNFDVGHVYDGGTKRE